MSGHVACRADPGRPAVVNLDLRIDGQRNVRSGLAAGGGARLGQLGKGQATVFVGMSTVHASIDQVRVVVMANTGAG